MSSLALRPFAPADVDSVFRLWSACEGLGHGPGDDPPSLGRFLDRNPEMSFVAERWRIVAGPVAQALARAPQAKHRVDVRRRERTQGEAAHAGADVVAPHGSSAVGPYIEGTGTSSRRRYMASWAR